MLRGVLFHPSQYENLFLSLVCSSGDVRYTLDAAKQAFAVIGKPGS
jgi:glutamate-1-semialdehyde 2,1-aminomutase